MSNQEQTLVIELNEFNQELLRTAAEQFNLSHIKRVLSFNNGLTLADQQQEHQGLDPWVQWVSVHSESPSQEHGIIRLGDIGKLEISQIWERLGTAGITTGVWGVMNAARKNASNNLFFVADPWTFTESAYPQELNQFLALPVYFAKNYLDLSWLQLANSALKTAWFTLRHIKLNNLFSDFLFLAKSLFKTKKMGTSFLFCSYELLATRVFTRYRKKYQPKVNFIFLNSIAHFQHHDWHSSEQLDANSEFVFRSIDRMLSIILPAKTANERVLVLSALSQRNVAEESFYCYRQINPQRFLNNIGLQYERVEQCMTNDGHVFFSTSADRDRAADVLGGAMVAERKAFFVEKDSVDPLKLFYQVAVWDKLDEHSMLDIGTSQIPFFSEFAIYAKRTGAHVPTGFYFADGLSFPDVVKNSDIFAHVWAR